MHESAVRNRHPVRTLALFLATYALCYVAFLIAMTASGEWGLSGALHPWLYAHYPALMERLDSSAYGAVSRTADLLGYGLVPLLAAVAVHHGLVFTRRRQATRCRRCRAFLRGIHRPVCPVCGQEI